MAVELQVITAQEAKLVLATVTDAAKRNVVVAEAAGSTHKTLGGNKMLINAAYIQDHLDRADDIKDDVMNEWSKKLAVHILEEAKQILGETQTSEVLVPLTFKVEPVIERVCIKICVQGKTICTGHMYP